MAIRILNIVQQSRVSRLFGHHDTTPNRSLIAVGAAGLLVATMGTVGFASRNSNNSADVELNGTASSAPFNDTQSSTPDTTPGMPIVTSTDSGSSSSASSHTSITVNDQPIEVPENGSTQRTIINEDGSHVDVSIDNQSVTSEGNNSNSSTHLNINSLSANTSVQLQHQTKTDISSD